MVSERIQGRIERLLDQIELEADKQDWPRVIDLAKEVLGYAQDNDDAKAFLRVAEERLSVTPSSTEQLGQGTTIATERSSPSASAPEAERRQLTVMFCDLQGSTALSQQLDPEELRDVIRGYQEVCAGAVSPFDGHIAKYLGDGLLVYFGYPQAHEDDPQRAVRAGLAILNDMSPLNAQLRSERDLELTVRIGIHTGLVVAGEMGGGDTLEELAIVGETPNIAARIEGAALPNSVVVSNITANLIQGFFLCETLGLHELKGISEPVELFRVLEESGAQTRFEVATAARLTTLVGREQEVGLLLDRWEQAEEGLGQVVLVSGEAGIGKSRLIDALGERLAEKTHIRWQLRCSAYHQTSTLHPLKEFLEIRLGFERDDSSEDKLAKLDDVLAASDEAPLLASLLSLPVDGRYRPLQLSPEGQKERTKEILAELLMETDTGQPVLLVVEDLHWADPTTLEFLSFLVEQAPTTKLLALLTFRPEFTQPWGSRAHLSQISLNRLPRRLANDLLTALTGGKEFPEEIVTQIAAKSDGVPLFVEELTRMVIESGLVLEVDGAYVLSGPLPALAIPSTLQDSLTARLDRLSSIRESIQLAAVLGREFSHELIRAVSPLDDATLVQHLEQLVTGEFLYQRGVPPDASYSFKHALIQDAAYNSLLISRRQQYHQLTARALGEHFVNVADAQPELLAHHYFEAGLTDDAVFYWLRAGEQSLSRYAWEEALTHFRSVVSAHNVESGGTEPAEDAEIARALFGLGRAQLATLQKHELMEAHLNLTRAFDYYANAGDTTRIVSIAELPIPPLTVGVQPGNLVERALDLVPEGSLDAGRLYSYLGQIQGIERGDYASAKHSFEQALVMAKRANDVDLEMKTLYNSAFVDWSHNNFKSALKASNLAVNLAVAASDLRGEIFARSWASISSRALGDMEELERQISPLLAAAERLGDRSLLSSAHSVAAWGPVLKGEWNLARERIKKSLDLLPRDPRMIGPAVVLAIQTGEQDYAESNLKILEEVVSQSDAAPNVANSIFAILSPLAERVIGYVSRPNLVELAISNVLSSPSATPFFSTWARIGAAFKAEVNGDEEAGKEHYAALKPLAGTDFLSVSIDRVLGLLKKVMGDWGQSVAHFEDALAFCRKAGYRTELAWTFCDYADTLLERDAEGDRTKAVSLLEESLAISTELEMPPLVGRVQARLETLSA